MTIQELTIDKKKYVLLPAKEYVAMQQDIIDLKKVISRRNETGIEAKQFFKELSGKKKIAKTK